MKRGSFHASIGVQVPAFLKDVACVPIARSRSRRAGWPVVVRAVYCRAARGRVFAPGLDEDDEPCAPQQLAHRARSVTATRENRGAHASPSSEPTSETGPSPSCSMVVRLAGRLQGRPVLQRPDAVGCVSRRSGRRSRVGQSTRAAGASSCPPSSRPQWRTESIWGVSNVPAVDELAGRLLGRSAARATMASEDRDPLLASAAMDWLLHDAHVLVFDGDSYRNPPPTQKRRTYDERKEVRPTS